ncbi:DUF6668 family protein [Streptomyces sp. NPDC048376]|uniref:DUF6668 family protein n=1 Tax=unclassified Streptomyces TaxID=2593676 RepID=UPI0034390D9D
MRDVPVVNPWLPAPHPAGGTNGKPQGTVQATLADLTGPRAPQGAGVPQPERSLPVAQAHPGSGRTWWWLGVHGGAGVSTLEQAVPGGRDAERAWPASSHSHSVVLVARSSAGGLKAAQSAAQQWASGMVTGIDLLGLVVVADAPGRRPKILQDLVRLVSGAVPRLWQIPWVEAWRLGEPPSSHQPKECAPLAHDLTRLTQPA